MRPVASARGSTADRDTDRGQEFDVQTQLEIDGRPVWSETCVFMARRLSRDTSKPSAAASVQAKACPRRMPKPCSPMGPDSVRTSRSKPTRASAGATRAWPATSIRFISPNFGARLFGFNQADRARHVVDGALSSPTLDAHTFDAPSRVDVVFKRPVSIPAPLTLETWQTAAGSGFALKGTGKGKVHLAGSVTPLVTKA